MQVTSFFESYLRNIKTCVERTDLELNLPEHNQAETSDVNRNAIALKSKRGQQPVDMETNNELNTILEETGDENLFNSINVIVASTPLNQREIVEQQESSVDAETLQPFETASPATSAPTSHPKRSSAQKVIRNRSTRPLTQRISEETSSEDELSPRKDIYVNHRRQNITTISSNTDAIDDDQDSDEDYPADSADQSKIPLKEAVLNVTKLDVSASSTKRFKKAFQDAESDEDEDEENHASKEGSVDSCSSSISAITSPNTGTTKSKATRKRKAPDEVSLRYNDRPIRKAKPKHFYVDSLKGKLRRPE